MSSILSPLSLLQQRLAAGETSPEQIAAEAVARSNNNAGKNVYLTANKSLAHEAETLAALPVAGRAPLYGVPISLKDCFDLTGHVTSCGSRFYAQHNLAAAKESWIAAQLRSVGALITGKTNMHQLAYGITGQNRDFGDCLQPADAELLTGGSSSGAAASVQEGSALASIGTDTGGSIRVPAALCGLAGFRASIDLASSIHAPIWHGGVHLAPSFDTLGLLFRDLRDGPALATVLLNLPNATQRIAKPRIATVSAAFLHDAEPQVLRAYAVQQDLLRSAGATLHEIDTAFWHDALEIFAPIQAHEAAHIQRHKLAAHFNSGHGADDLHPAHPHFSVFEPSIAERLLWGETFPPEAIAALRLRHKVFRDGMDAILTRHDLLLLPCAPVGQLRADADHSTTRARILRYTTPVSLAGFPAVTLPHPDGTGMQLAASRGQDAALLDYAARLVL